MKASAGTREIRFGVYKVDLRSGELYKHGLRLKLQDQPFKILVLLLERPGDVVTREELRQKLWPADTFVDFDTSLNTAIKKLRDALCDSAEKPRYIETLPRRGYRFIAQVETGDSTVLATVHEKPAVVPLPTPVTVTKRWRVLGVAVFVLLLIVAVASW